MISAIYFDGNDGRMHAVKLSVKLDEIQTRGADIARSDSTVSTRLEEPFDHAPCILQFADGARCEVHEVTAKQALLAALNYRKSLVTRWQDKWLGALAAIVLMLVALASGYYWGIPWAADLASNHIPLAVEKRLGDEALAGLDKELFKPSKLTAERQQQTQEIFRNISRSVTRMPMQLVFRDADFAGPNAFALPNGTIVMTDEMIDFIVGKTDKSSKELGEQLAGVLAHEIGHVEGKHSLKIIVAGSMIGAMTWALFGDFSAVAAGAPALALHMKFSRAMETEADDYAAALLKKDGVPAARLAELFESLEENHKRNPMADMPEWMRTATDYLSTHPSSQERMERLRMADQR